MDSDVLSNKLRSVISASNSFVSRNMKDDRKVIARSYMRIKRGRCRTHGDRERTQVKVRKTCVSSAESMALAHWQKLPAR